MSGIKVNGEAKFCAVDTDWKYFEKDVRRGMDTINKIHGSMTRAELHMSELHHLKQIADKLTDINDRLIGPATSLERIPFRVLWIQFVFFFATMVAASTILILDKIKHTDTNVAVGKDGLSIGHGAK